jgi:cysteinyl-tRNA synthetase
MSNPRAFNAQVFTEAEEAITTLRELLERIDDPSEASTTLRELLAQTVIDAPLRSRHGDDIRFAAIVAVLDDLASRVRELEA